MKPNKQGNDKLNNSNEIEYLSSLKIIFQILFFVVIFEFIFDHIITFTEGYLVQFYSKDTTEILSEVLQVIIVSIFFIPITFYFIIRPIKKINHELFKKHQLNLQQKERLEHIAKDLSKYLPPQLYNKIFKGEKDVKIETNRKKLTIFFSDIVGFTEITDMMEAEALSCILNSYLNEMALIALKFGATIDKFIGDAVMIFFGDPETKGDKKDAVSCVYMALAMKEKMAELQEHWKEKGIARQLKIRIGINTGFCTVGNFGAENRLDYTIIGGQVNLASRLESMACADQILISSETYNLVKDIFNCEKKEKLKVKGIAIPVQAYEVLSIKKQESASNMLINKKTSGISLTLDLNKINKDQAVKKLKEVISDLEQS